MAEEERRRRLLAACAVDFSFIQAGADAHRPYQPLQRVTSQLNSQLDRAVEQSLDTATSTWDTPLPESPAIEDDDEEIPLFSTLTRAERDSQPSHFVSPAVLETAKAISLPEFVLEREAKKLKPLSRSSWLQSGFSDSDEEIENAPSNDNAAVELIFEQHSPKVVVEEGEDIEDDPGSMVSLFSTSVLEKRVLAKRERPDRRRVEDRSMLAQLCTFSTEKWVDVPNLEIVEASLPADGNMITLPLTHGRHKISHQRWVFEDHREQVLDGVSSRTRRRHPGVLRKLARDTPLTVMMPARVEREEEELAEAPPESSAGTSVVAEVHTPQQLEEAIQVKKRKSQSTKPKNFF